MYSTLDATIELQSSFKLTIHSHHFWCSICTVMRICVYKSYGEPSVLKNHYKVYSCLLFIISAYPSNGSKCASVSVAALETQKVSVAIQMIYRQHRQTYIEDYRSFIM